MSRGWRWGDGGLEQQARRYQQTRLAGGGGQGIWDRGTPFLWIQGKALLLTQSCFFSPPRPALNLPKSSD